MLQAGATGIDRKDLAEQTGIPQSKIEEFVKLADLARIPGVKGTRARLYFEAGFDSVEKIASLEPDEFRELVVDYVDQSGFEAASGSFRGSCSKSAQTTPFYGFSAIAPRNPVV